jgi:putative FmdB family regulatory protein
MPSYEYRCQDCRRKFEIFMSYSEYGTKPVTCKYCKSEKVLRVINRVRIARSDESRLENMADPANLASLDEDPKSLGRMMRQMSGQVGEDMGPEFDEVVRRLESGQSPDQIEKELPDLGEGGAGDMGGMGGMGDLGGGDDLGADLA